MRGVHNYLILKCEILNSRYGKSPFPAALYWDYNDYLCGSDHIPPAATKQRSTALWRQNSSGRDLYGEG